MWNVRLYEASLFFWRYSLADVTLHATRTCTAGHVQAYQTRVLESSFSCHTITQGKSSNPAYIYVHARVEKGGGCVCVSVRPIWNTLYVCFEERVVGLLQSQLVAFHSIIWFSGSTHQSLLLVFVHLLHQSQIFKLNRLIHHVPPRCRHSHPRLHGKPILYHTNFFLPLPFL